MHLNNDPRKKLSTSLSPPQSLGKNKGVSMPREKTRIEAHKKQHLFYYSLISFSIFLRLSFDLYRLPYPNSIHITPIITRYTCNTFTHHATTLVTHSFHSTYHHRPPSNIHIPSNDKKLLLLSHPPSSSSSFFLLPSFEQHTHVAVPPATNFRFAVLPGRIRLADDTRVRVCVL